MDNNGIETPLKPILDTLPVKAGCYLMKDCDGKIIYVGKAVNLRSRVRSYFHKSANHTKRIKRMVSRVEDIEVIVVGSELEALILEMNLIKKHQPHYNVRLKDDKRFPYIKVHWKDDYPKVTVTRQMLRDGSRYFGPYTSVWAVHKTLDVMRKIFPYLTCDREITGEDDRACLYYDIKLCTAPCTGKVSNENYRRMIEDLCQFLNGRTDPVTSRLQEEMEAASGELNFEKAATIRDQILAIEKVVEKQKVVSSKYVDSDVIAMARSKREACIQVFFIRNGRLIGSEYFLLDGTEEETDRVVITQFIKQFYDQAANFPSQVLLPSELEEANIINQWMNSHSETRIEMKIPQRGQKRQLVEMAAENAAETLNTLQAKWDADAHRQTQSLSDLQAGLKLKEPPNRIECYDISNTQGTAITASMVVFEQGIPNKSHYRRFNIRNVIGKADDYASMDEALARRFRRWYSAKQQKDLPGKKPDPSFSRLPDLLIVDGGKGQLSRAMQVVEQFGLTGKFVVAGLAKKNETLYTTDHMEGLLLPRNSQGLYLMQRIRDEAHRFAITAHRKRRQKIGMASILDKVPGIGPARRKSLLSAFGSVEDIRQASAEELSAVRGINEELAQNIKDNLA